MTEAQATKKWKVFYDDGARVMAKDGYIESQDSNFVYLRVYEKLQAIPLSRILRMEEIK